MPSCLEQRGNEERERELIKNNYTYYDQYSATHKDALADGDTKGRGIGSSQSWWLPNCDSTVLEAFSYRGLNTSTYA
ncbi:hypothetical protein EZS27_032989 [termite gut metagenome]|uniref:Uncharacterized protein n=1 Tax=termite gut metagenome TaxID=433724 RepID=A0A5J4Q7P6_9ZZZZ